MSNESLLTPIRPKVVFPAAPAIYSVWHILEEEVCIYVGATSNLKDRIRKLRHAHPQWFKETNAVRWTLCTLEQLQKLETQEILELCPVANKTLQGYSGKRGKTKRKEVKTNED